METRQCSEFTARRLAEDAGATAAEYAVLVALISAVVVGAVAAIGTATFTSFNDFSAAFQAAMN